MIESIYTILKMGDMHLGFGFYVNGDLMMSYYLVTEPFSKVD